MLQFRLSVRPHVHMHWHVGGIKMMAERTA